MAIINSCTDLLPIIPCEREPLHLDYYKSFSVTAALHESLWQGKCHSSPSSSIKNIFGNRAPQYWENVTCTALYHISFLPSGHRKNNLSQQCGSSFSFQEVILSTFTLVVRSTGAHCVQECNLQGRNGDCKPQEKNKLIKCRKHEGPVSITNASKSFLSQAQFLSVAVICRSSMTLSCMYATFPLNCVLTQRGKMMSISFFQKLCPSI